ncbi:hypothetical protein [Ensifer adhaerens]|uniref:hypothetical protein n=1 Tax=Ensifer adhaerens TaxID=106592 RepID=UPI00098F4F5B|nr:hypothetical protein [Ensifer adhaerens]
MIDAAERAIDELSYDLVPADMIHREIAKAALDAGLAVDVGAREPTPDDIYRALRDWYGEDDEWSHNQYVAMDRVLRNAAALSAAVVGEPEGWKLVPVDPTPEMIDAGRLARMNIAGGYDGPSSWEAMLAAAPSAPDGWQPIDTAPRDTTSIIIAVPTKDYDGHIVGEAYFDPEHYEDGDWWWANTDHGDYHGGPISEINFHGPSHWQPLPAPPAIGGKP